jgi:phosphopantothenoylcysteine decarboxylase / phosphopantothenate---cysteine ligase
VSEGRVVAPLTPRRPWKGRNILLGVTGGIAAYKSVQIARDLTQLGATVDVILTPSAREFVGAVTFEALTGRPVYTELVAAGSALDHIKLARNCDVVLVAPATADLLARAASGRSDDLITAVLLATKAPVLLAPAMNDQMWAHPQVQLNAAHARDVLGYQLIGPGTGALAYGEGVGAGRMEEGSVIIDYVGRALEDDAALRGKRIIVTGGPTREPVDPVRVLSNRSSGKMGYAIAAAAWRRGADVLLISGPTSLAEPVGAKMQRVETAEEMASAVRAAVADADALIMAAAVADFRPAAPANSKIKKSSAVSAIELEPAPDILKSTREFRAKHLRVVGFALETDAHEENARKKLAEKGLDFIVLNDAREPGAGFEVSTNKVTLIHANSADIEQLPLLSKDDVADAILDRLAALF